jgi:hypothetical protein
MSNIHLLDRTLSYHLFILDLICFMYKCRFNVDFGDGVALILISTSRYRGAGSPKSNGQL